MSIVGGRGSLARRPTRIGVEFGAVCTSVTNICVFPSIGRIDACWSRPPRANRTCVVSAGN
jgi:hypothetical protein